METKFTEEDIDNCWEYHKRYLVEILNDDYSLDDAHADLKSLINSKYDKREDA